MKRLFLSHLNQLSKCNGRACVLHVCQQQHQNLHLLVKQGVKIFLLFQALTSFARDTLGHHHHILCKHLSFRSIFSSQEPFRDVKSLKVFSFYSFFLLFGSVGFFFVYRLTLQLWAVTFSVAVPWIAQCWGEVFYMNCSV